MEAKEILKVAAGAGGALVAAGGTAAKDQTFDDEGGHAEDEFERADYDQSQSEYPDHNYLRQRKTVGSTTEQEEENPLRHASNTANSKPSTSASVPKTTTETATKTDKVENNEKDRRPLSSSSLARRTGHALSQSWSKLRKQSMVAMIGDVTHGCFGGRRRAEQEQERPTIAPSESCLSCQQFPVCHLHGRYSLISYEETPDFMKGNPYVTGGYRPPSITVNMCLQSAFQINNETVNIWSHICGFFIFGYFIIVDNLETLPAKNANWMDHIIFTAGLLCFMICMSMSACFHMFWCMSQSSHDLWLTLDLLGVTFGLLGCYITGIHYAFYCFTFWHNLYMSIFATLAFITISAPIHPEYASVKFYWHRLSLYVLIGAYGFIPTCHWVVQHGGLESDFTVRFLPSVIMVYGLCGLGVFFYILMIPERWLPGWFDFIGWSHQWWHLLILSGLIMWRFAGLEILTFRRETEC